MKAERRRWVGVAAVLVASLVTASVAGASPSRGASTPAKKAKGEPVVFALINTENAPRAQFQERRARISMQAAIDFVNEERGGFGGRPGKLEFCLDDATATQSAACANELVAKQPVAFLGGQDIAAFAAQPILDASGIPVLGGGTAFPAQVLSPTNFAFIPSSVGLTNYVKFAAENLKAKKVNLLLAEAPASKTTAETLLRPALTKEGVSFREEYYPFAPPDSPPLDVSAAVAAIVRDDPDAVIFHAVSPRECPLILHAMKATGTKAKLLGFGCGEVQNLKDAGSDAEGLYYGTPWRDFTGSSKDGKLFRTKLDKYATEDVALDSLTLQAFSTVLNTEALLDEIGGDKITAASILTAVRDTKNQANFLAHPYTCDGKAVKDRPAVCQNNYRFFKFTNGKLVDRGVWVNGSDLLG